MAKRHISARALRFLFASGVLRSKGSGKNRTVTYDKDRAATTARLRKRGVNVASRKKASQTNTSGRFVFGGSKAARLRSGSGASKRVVPSKADHSATRVARITAAQRTFRPGRTSEGQATRLQQEITTRLQNPNMRGSVKPAERQIASLKPRALSARVEMLSRKRLPVNAESLGGTGREFSQRLKALLGKRDKRNKRTAGVRALKDKYGYDSAARIVARETGGRRIQR